MPNSPYPPPSKNDRNIEGGGAGWIMIFAFGTIAGCLIYALVRTAMP